MCYSGPGTTGRIVHVSERIDIDQYFFQPVYVNRDHDHRSDGRRMGLSYFGSSSAVATVFHPCFSPSIHSRPSGVLSIFWHHDQLGLGGWVYLLPRSRSKEGNDILLLSSSCGVDDGWA